MRTIDVADATDTLSHYARKGLKETLVVTRRGKPLAALTPIRKGDWESIAVATNPKFLAIIERSRASHKPGTGISTEEMRRRLALKRRR
jgi:antitoxin (DNA-binding transcriptional repressor) of toxin-antitoxin stability system